MANKRIKDLTNYTAPINSDVIAIEDLTANETKKITRENFFTGNPLPVDTVDTQSIQNDTITADKIKDTASGGGGLLRNVVKFNASGTYTKPTGLKFAVIYLQGAGGGGGGVGATTGTGTAGGGASGASNKKLVLASDIATSTTVTIGNAGLGGSGNVAGATGGFTRFPLISSATGFQAVGGEGGQPSTGATVNNRGGNRGFTSPIVGDLHIEGMAGFQSGATWSGAGGGYGGGLMRTSADPGSNASANSGAGGGGAYGTGTFAETGGVGGNGYCLIYEYF